LLIAAISTFGLYRLIYLILPSLSMSIIVLPLLHDEFKAFFGALTVFLSRKAFSIISSKRVLLYTRQWEILVSDTIQDGKPTR